MPTPRPHPKAQLLTLLTQPDRLERLRSAAAFLGETDAERSAAFVRCAMLQSDLMVPAGQEPAALIRSLAQLGWQVWPAVVEAPQVGDLFVEGEFAALGFVTKLDTAGAFFLAAEQGEARRRVEVGAAAYWVRLPGG